MADYDATQYTARLRSTPAYQAAVQKYQQRMAAIGRPPTIAQQRNEDSGQAERYRAAVTAAKTELGQSVASIISSYGLPGDLKDWHYNPDSGALVYEEDHSGRNILIAVGGIIAAGAFASAGGGAAASSAGATAGDVGTVAGPGIAGVAGGGGAVAPVAAGGGAGFLGISSTDIFRTGASLFGNLYAAHEQISAADRAAETQAAAYKYSADLQAKANADSLAFQYANAENAFQNNEVSRHGNYDIFRARERRLGTIGDEVGLGPREIPDYVPGVDPHFTGTGNNPSGSSSSGGAGTMPGAGEVDWTAAPDALGQQLSAYFSKRGVAPDEVPYWVKQAGTLVERGRQLGDPHYADKRLAAADIFGGGGGMFAPPKSAPQSTQTGDTPYMQPVRSPLVPQAFGYYA